MRLRSTALLIVLMSGCALDHGRDGREDSGGETSPSPFCAPLPPLPSSGEPVQAIPDGACRDEDGRVFAFAEGCLAGCEPTSDGRLSLLASTCGPATTPTLASVVGCGVVRGPVRFAWREHTFSIEVPPGACAPLGSNERTGATDVTPVPTPEPFQLCTVGARDCRRPVQLRVDLRGRSPCAPPTYRDECTAWWTGDAIEIRAESTQVPINSCSFAVVPRELHCTAMVAEPGTYPVRMEDGRELGSITVRDGPVPRELECVPVP